ncbi:unnamed protein product [Dicrocoelium dendriticum]|nr:unnamed protein product [Dicrocoelium dendriticum]
MRTNPWTHSVSLESVNAATYTQSIALLEPQLRELEYDRQIHQLRQPGAGLLVSFNSVLLGLAIAVFPSNDPAAKETKIFQQVLEATVDPGVNREYLLKPPAELDKAQQIAAQREHIRGNATGNTRLKNRTTCSFYWRLMTVQTEVGICVNNPQTAIRSD